MSEKPVIQEKIKLGDATSRIETLSPAGSGLVAKQIVYNDAGKKAISTGIRTTNHKGTKP